MPHFSILIFLNNYYLYNSLASNSNLTEKYIDLLLGKNNKSINSFLLSNKSLNKDIKIKIIKDEIKKEIFK
mgnify:CR=1 FL=1